MLHAPLTSSTSGRGETRYAQRKMQSCLYLDPLQTSRQDWLSRYRRIPPLAKLHRMLSLALFSLVGEGVLSPATHLFPQSSYSCEHSLILTAYCTVPLACCRVLPRARWSTSALLDRAPALRISMPPFNGGAGLLHNKHLDIVVHRTRWPRKPRFRLLPFRVFSSLLNPRRPVHQSARPWRQRKRTPLHRRLRQASFETHHPKS
jgi:hypothetical protein